MSAKEATYYVKLDVFAIIPRGSETSARAFCEKMDWDYVGYRDRYAWSSAMQTYIRDAWAVGVSVCGQQTLLDKDSVIVHDGDAIRWMD